MGKMAAAGLVAAMVILSASASARGTSADYSLAECEEKVRFGQDAGLLTGIRPAASGGGFEVFVDGPVWRRMAFASKENVAGCLSLIFMKGKRGELVRLTFLDRISGRAVGVFPPYSE